MHVPIVSFNLERKTIHHYWHIEPDKEILKVIKSVV